MRTTGSATSRATAAPRPSPGSSLSRVRTSRGSERGAALLELAFVGLLLCMVVFATIDYGRVAQLQNRLSNAAREGAAVARITPAAVDTGCDGRHNVVDRASGQDLELSQQDGFDVTVAKIEGDVRQQYRGCGSPTGGVDIAPGDRVVVTVTAHITMYSPFADAVTGSPMTLSREVETVVHG